MKILKPGETPIPPTTPETLTGACTKCKAVVEFSAAEVKGPRRASLARYGWYWSAECPTQGCDDIIIIYPPGSEGGQ